MKASRDLLGTRVRKGTPATPGPSPINCLRFVTNIFCPINPICLLLLRTQQDLWKGQRTGESLFSFDRSRYKRLDIPASDSRKKSTDMFRKPKHPKRATKSDFLRFSLLSLHSFCSFSRKFLREFSVLPICLFSLTPCSLKFTRINLFLSAFFLNVHRESCLRLSDQGKTDNSSGGFWVEVCSESEVSGGLGRSEGSHCGRSHVGGKVQGTRVRRSPR